METWGVEARKIKGGPPPTNYEEIFRNTTPGWVINGKAILDDSTAAMLRRNESVVVV